MEGESLQCPMESMWRYLPECILENIFTFLPTASLCRFKTLSNRWNRYFCSPDFKHSHAPEEYVLISPQWGRSMAGVWDVLDVANKRYLSFSDDFLTKHVGLAPGKHLQRTFLEAADGGLFCVRCFFTKKNSGLFICNPVLKAVKQLPHMEALEWPNSKYERRKVVMSTDRASMEYEIFVLLMDDDYQLQAPIFIYESKAGSWRGALYTPPKFPIEAWWHTLTIFDNNQYVITEVDIFREPDRESRGGLMSYNKDTGAVTDLVGIDFPLVSRPHLVVSNGRLFCVVTTDEDFPSVTIYELNVATRESTLMTEMPSEIADWVFGFDLLLCETLPSDVTDADLLPKAMPTASADSILVCNVLGRCAAYNLSTKSWYQFPEDPVLVYAYCRTDNLAHKDYCGSGYCLSLCAP